MCTVAHVLKCHYSCHLCNLIFVGLMKDPRKRYGEVHGGSNVYLQPRVEHRSGCLVVSVAVAESVDTRGNAKAWIANFRLRDYNYSDVERTFHQHITAKQVPRYARDNLTRARDWIGICTTQHERCQSFQQNTVDSRQRPSRILQVTETSARLRCDMSDQPYDYLVLSHRWEQQSREQVQLLESSLADFQIDIPWDMLCASSQYKEAIRVTCALGYQYLWIDSLCIMQKSDSDWQHEASRMAIVYGNAVCNISLIFPTQQEMEDAARNDPRDWNSCILREATPIHPGLYLERVTHVTNLPSWLEQDKWPLFERAWTFQEYLLSPRTLLVGHSNLMFQCSELFYDELLGPMGDGNGLIIDEEKSSKVHDFDFQKSFYFPATLGIVKDCPSLTQVPVLLFLQDWLKVFNEYRARKLTVTTDRVIAFAGVARVFSHLSRMTYLAGAWQECLAPCLLWHLDKKPNDIAMRDNRLPNGSYYDYAVIVQEAAQTCHIPSWSWFSAPIYAYHNLHFLFLDVLSLRRKSNLKPPMACVNDISWAQLQHFQFGAHPQNSFLPSRNYADFCALGLTLRMRTLPVSAQLPIHLCSQLAHIKRFPKHPEDATLDCDPVFTYYHDDIAKPRRNPPRNALFALLAEIQIVRLGGKYHVQRILAGLVLVPSDREEGAWKRVGAWKLKVKIWGWLVDRANLLSVAERWKGYEIVGKVWGSEEITIV